MTFCPPQRLGNIHTAWGTEAIRGLRTVTPQRTGCGGRDGPGTITPHRGPGGKGGRPRTITPHRGPGEGGGTGRGLSPLREVRVGRDRLRTLRDSGAATGLPAALPAALGLWCRTVVRDNLRPQRPALPQPVRLAHSGTVGPRRDAGARSEAQPWPGPRARK